MLAIKTSLGAQSPARLLSARYVLRRLRPLKLETIVFCLGEYSRLARTLWLLQTHCPLMLDVYDYPRKKLPHWSDIFRDFLQNVEARDWFEVDWDLLTDDEGQDYFARWLYEIPVLVLGFSDYDESWPERYPQLALLKALLDPNWDQSGSMLLALCEEYGIDTDWCANSWDLWDRLNGEEFAELEEPLCWLPDVARVVCALTGNEILDCANYMEEEPLGWTWDDDLEKVQGFWQAAKPTVDKWRAFVQWCDGPGEMQRLAEVLLAVYAEEDDDDGGE